MKERIKAAKDKTEKTLNMLGNIILVALLIEGIVVVVLQLFAGSVESVGVIFALIITAEIATEVAERKYKKNATQAYREYRLKVTAEAILFLNKGQLTNRELKKFMAVMRYAAKENKWEE